MMSAAGAALPLGRMHRPLTPAELARRAEAADRAERRIAAQQIPGSGPGRAAHHQELPPAATPAGSDHDGETAPPARPASPAAGERNPPPPRREPDLPDGRLPRVIRDGAPVDEWVASDNGLRRWRPIVDRIEVTPLPDGGVLYEVTGARPLRIDAGMRAHLALCLMPESWRRVLDAAGVIEAAGVLP